MITFQQVERLSVVAKAIGVAALFITMVAVDTATGLDLTLRALYLAPVSAAAWLLGRRAGLLVAILSVAVSSYFDVALGLERKHVAFVYGDAVMRLAVYVTAAAVLSQLHDAQRRLRELAQIDPLTGLYNRRGFQAIGQREIARAKRTRGSLTMVELDLDGFKGVNDELGHAEGDDVLVAVGHALRSSRAIDVAARLGGDEFALLLPETAASPGERTVERIVARLNETMATRSWPITFSVGVVTFHSPPASLDEMIALADTLMYEVKRNGKAAIRYRTVGAAIEV